MEINKSPKVAKIFVCDKCNYKCSKECDYNKHILTRKHEKLSFGNEMEIAGNEKVKKTQFPCEKCKKNYKTNSGLWKHTKVCNSITTPTPDNNVHIPADQEIIQMLIKENTDFKNMFQTILLDVVKSNKEIQNQMLEAVKQTNNNNIQNSHNNNHSHNKTFNLQLFLNEQCKDAMNIMDFVNSVTLQLSDLESVGQLGYVEGITKIMIKKLTEMDIYKRPVHCSDAKREIIHIKDNDVWEKEDATYPKLRRAIKYITKKNSDLLLVWSAKYPESKNIYSKVNETYMNIMVHQAMGGTGEVTENENKIIKKISKMILIDK